MSDVKIYCKESVSRVGHDVRAIFGDVDTVVHTIAYSKIDTKPQTLDAFRKAAQKIEVFKSPNGFQVQEKDAHNPDAITHQSIEDSSLANELSATLYQITLRPSS